LIFALSIPSTGRVELLFPVSVEVIEESLVVGEGDD